MNSSLAELAERLQNDPWRLSIGFESGLAEVLCGVLRPEATDAEVTDAFNNWISKNQPCLFGRVAAKAGALTYCLIREAELEDDRVVETKIQKARLLWKKRAIKGESSGFIIAVLSSKLACGTPDETMLRIALRIASLYLHEPVEADQVYLDSVRLEQPGERRRTWEWLAGVNVFAAQGDKRWWQDHRFPAGLVFSVNSVGHFVKSGMLNNAMHHLEQVMGTLEEGSAASKVDTLPKALNLAMRTIALASSGPSGKATSLLPLADGRAKCPIELPEFLHGKDHCEYAGLYHTDYTVPSEYFTGAVEVPFKGREYSLDFSYLYDESLDNFDYARMGERRIGTVL